LKLVWVFAHSVPPYTLKLVWVFAHSVPPYTLKLVWVFAHSASCSPQVAHHKPHTLRLLNSPPQTIENKTSTPNPKPNSLNLEVQTANPKP